MVHAILFRAIIIISLYQKDCNGSIIIFIHVPGHKEEVHGFEHQRSYCTTLQVLP